MEKLFVLFVLAFIANGVLCRPQSDADDTLDDRYGSFLFDAQGNAYPMPNNWNRPDRRPSRPTRPVRPVTTATPPTVTTASTAECERNCPGTPEYNPVCGTNLILYNNPGRLECARSCGVNVSLLRAAPCPPTTPAPTS